MLRRWCIPLAVLAVTFGSALAASSASAAPAPAAAKTAVVRPAESGGAAMHVITPKTRLGAHSGIRNETSSTNWSGYAADSGTYTSVSASWVEPTGSCTSATRYSSFWVGLDGYSSSSVEQTGTDTDCVDGSPSYYGWYEMYPAGSVDYSNVVEPGDTIDASVTYEGSNEFQLVLSDVTRGWTKTTTKSLSGAARSSAEVIIEAPCCTSSGGILPLADFGTVNISGAEVDGSPIGDSDPVEIIMVDSSGADKDTVSALSGGENFSATWEKAN